MQQVSALILPQSLFPTTDTLMSVAKNFEISAKPAVRFKYGSNFVQVGWVDSVVLKEDGLHGVLTIPTEGAEQFNQGKLEVRGEISLVAMRSVIEEARLVEVKLLPK